MPMASLARRPTVLIILHQEHSTPGRVGLALKAMGVRLDMRRPSFGEPLPATLADHDGVVVFGGPMGANDTLDWVRREIEWLETPLAEEKPLLGLCLGAQMLARALGDRVFSYDDKRSEIGYYPIEPASAGDRLCSAPFPRTVYQWHSDGFDLPDGMPLVDRARKRGAAEPVAGGGGLDRVIADLAALVVIAEHPGAERAGQHLRAEAQAEQRLFLRQRGSAAIRSRA